MTNDRESAFLLALGASIAVHAFGAGVAALYRPEVPVAVSRVEQSELVDLEWLQEPSTPAEPEPDPEPVEELPAQESEPSSPPAAEDPAVETPAQQEPSVDPQASEGAVASEPPAGEHLLVDPNAAGRPPTHRVPSLDPRSAALGALDLQPYRPAPQDQPVAEDPQARFRRAEASLDSHLAGIAARRPAVSERPRPQVRRQADGSYQYNGHAFSAHINRDGTVSFSDRGAVRYAGGGDSENSASVAFGFDLTDGAYRRRGQDPYQAERAWFMRETEDMRAELQEAARERGRTEMVRRVAGRVQHVWNTEERSEPQRRRRIFSIWDDCAEGDADGDAARRAILSWVRRNLPQGSDQAFSAAELSSLNAGRQSTQVFAPY